MFVTHKLKRVLGLAFLSTVLTLVISQTCWALTIEKPLPPSYVQEYPDEWTVKVKAAEDGQVKFTVVRSLQAPQYLVAHLAVYHHGKLIATSDSPAFGRTHDNTFYFSVAREDLADAKFSLSESTIGGSGDDAVPSPGSIIYHLPLKEFFADAADKASR